MSRGQGAIAPGYGLGTEVYCSNLDQAYCYRCVAIHGHTGAVFPLDISWGKFPQSVEFPQRPVLFPAVKTISFDFPTVNLVLYTKNVIQQHQIHNNWLKIEWVKNFFCDPEN